MSLIPEVPFNIDPMHRHFLKRVKLVLELLPQAFSSPPGDPSDLRVTPGPGMNLVEWTGGTGATSHHIYASTTPTWNPTHPENHVFDVGASSAFPHSIGINAVPRYYWVAAFRGVNKSKMVGPVLGTTLALNAPRVPTGAASQPGNVTVNIPGGLPTINLPTLSGGGRGQV